MDFGDSLFQVFQDSTANKVNVPIKRQREVQDEYEEIANEYYVIKEDVEGCTHECAYPVGYQQVESLPKTPVKTYPFKLDAFQRCAIKCIENNESVLVAAHTSAGKTAIAEYAIATALNKNQRVIYTSPIKALSNQKYREFHDEFKDVGLMTGDVTINETASCLVMTTEILRSMLYKGSEVIREMAWVVFDEIHYMRDKERGVVWEETIILLPEAVKLVFLSATIPNALEFAEWICKVKKDPCHVVYTEYRPTPLQHFIYPAGGEGLYLVVDEKGRFKEKNFKKAISCLSEPQDGRTTKKVGNGNNSEVTKIVQLIMEKDMKPAIVFSFSKRECESYAIALNKYDWTSAEEKVAIQQIFENAIDTLAEEDKSLPMIQNVLPLLKKGVGIHHGGLLPIIKEVTEILFQEGFVKCLFSTETFSMGLNMPARTVVFTNVRKFDGETFRWISGGEYIQMSGRAGRRGIDDKGICILMVDQKMEPEVAKGMVKGHADALNSMFHLSYNMLLNLMRIEDSHPEHMIKKSFHQFQNDRACPEVNQKKIELQNKLNEIAIECEQEMDDYNHMQATKNAFKGIVKKVINEPDKIMRFMLPGRLIYIIDHRGIEWGWGVVTGHTRKRVDKRKLKDMTGEVPVTYVLDVIVYALIDDKPIPIADLDAEGGEGISMQFHLDCLDKVSSVRLFVNGDIKSKDTLKNAIITLRQVFKQLNGIIPLLDPINDLKITDPGFIDAISKISELEEREKTLPIVSRVDFSEIKAKYQDKKTIQDAINLLNRQLKASKTMILKDD